MKRLIRTRQGLIIGGRGMNSNHRILTLILCLTLLIQPSNLIAEDSAMTQEQFYGYFDLTFPSITSHPNDGIGNISSIKDNEKTKLSVALHVFPAYSNRTRLADSQEIRPGQVVDLYICYSMATGERVFMFCNSRNDEIVSLFTMYPTVEESNLFQLVDRRATLEEIYEYDRNTFFNTLVSCETRSFHPTKEGVVYSINYLYDGVNFRAIQIEIADVGHYFPYVYRIINPCDYPQ